MTAESISPPRPLAMDRPTVAFLALAVGLTIVRIAGLVLTPLDLHGDEAQYWLWSRDLAWGYFSKPPLIAWAIAATTALFGDAEWAVRLAAPLAHACGALALFVLGRRLYGPAAGFWAGALWLLMPGVWLSAAVISTDALLLPLWSAALLSFFAFLETRRTAWAVALGVAIGAGFLAKYAMSYFLVGLALAAVLSPSARRALTSPKAALALAIAALILTPNLLWNAQHDFATIAHTADNADVSAGLRFSLSELGQFFVDQLAVFGPLSWIALAGAIILLVRAKALSERERLLLAFILPPLAVIMVQAFLSRANANWAAAAYPAATVLLAGLAASDIVKTAALRAAPRAIAGFHGLVGAVFLAAGVAPAFADAVGLADAFKRSRNWEETAALVAARAATAGAEGPYSAVLVDDRLLFNDLSYYWRDRPPPAPLRIWLLESTAQNHAQSIAPMSAALGEKVLVVGAAPAYENAIAADFDEVGPLTRVEIDLGGGEVRRLSFRDARGFAPVPR